MFLIEISESEDKDTALRFCNLFNICLRERLWELIPSIIKICSFCESLLYCEDENNK